MSGMRKTSSTSWYSSASCARQDRQRRARGGGLLEPVRGEEQGEEYERTMARMAVGCLVVWWCMWMNQSASTSCDALRDERDVRDSPSTTVPRLRGERQG